MGMGKAKVVNLLDDVIATGAGVTQEPLGTKRTFHASGETSAAAGAATIDIEVSNDVNTDSWAVVDTLSLTLGTVTTSDSFVLDAAFKYVRANVKTISGTDATVRVNMGLQL